jgi:hypothetical protein
LALSVSRAVSAAVTSLRSSVRSARTRRPDQVRKKAAETVMIAVPVATVEQPG